MDQLLRHLVHERALDNEWRGAELHGRTPVGRTTIDVLNINDRDRVELRKMLVPWGLFLSIDH